MDYNFFGSGPYHWISFTMSIHTSLCIYNFKKLQDAACKNELSNLYYAVAPTPRSKVNPGPFAACQIKILAPAHHEEVFSMGYLDQKKVDGNRIRVKASIHTQYQPAHNASWFNGYYKRAGWAFWDVCMHYLTPYYFILKTTLKAITLLRLLLLLMPAGCTAYW